MKKVLLGMSGGVDSSVAAILLKNAGYEVIGVTMHLYEGGCCNLSSTLDAKIVCKNIGIEHVILDYKQEFKDIVIDDFIDEYGHARTPNPCIRCNKYLKFGLMYEKAKELGIDYVATGHYARCEFDEKYNQDVLKKAVNIAKDQSYVLYNIKRDMLDKVLFPLGNFKSKDEVRQIAKENNLRVFSKPDSEDICFIPDGNYKKFLEENSNLKPREGNIINNKGEILGKHKGLYNYTVGQRKGLGISYSEPLFVLGFNTTKNELIVGTQNELYKDEILVEDYNLMLMDDLRERIDVNVKTRYSSNEAEAEISKIMIDNKTYIRVKFKEPQMRITPGQSAVFYIDDTVLGGGIIKK